MIAQDKPIITASDDILKRDSFAENLAKVLMDNSFPDAFAIGLYGKWGSGKTSLMNMIIEKVENSEKDEKENASVVVLRFNPWMCTDAKQLTSQFLTQMSSAIGGIEKGTSDKICELLDQYGDALSATSLIPVAGTAIAAVGEAVTQGARSKNEKKRQDLQELKKKISDKLKKDRIKIIAAIDDIDRLSEEEIVAVFQLVKALGDFPHMIYLLAFDYDVVVRALGKVQQGDGREYLEKIIQVPIEVPQADTAKIQDAFLQKLNETIADYPDDRFDRSAWSVAFHYGLRFYMQSMRDIIRYINVLSIKYELLKGETDLADLLALTGLQVFEPILYQRLHDYKESLCGDADNYAYANSKRRKDMTRSTIDTLFSDETLLKNVMAAKNLLGMLFPRTQSVMDVSYAVARIYDHRQSLVKHNIANLDCFDRYFSLSLEDGAIPTFEVSRFIHDANDDEMCEKLEHWYQEGKIIRFLEELEAYANMERSLSIPQNRMGTIVFILALCWHKFDVPDDAGLFAVPFRWRLLFCVDPLLRGMNQLGDHQAESVLHDIFNDTRVHPSTLALLLHDFELQNGRFTEKQSDGGRKPVVSLEYLQKLESEFIDHAMRELEHENILLQEERLDYLWMLELLQPEKTREIKRGLVKDDKSLVSVIRKHIIHNAMTGAVRLPDRTWTVKLKALGEFVDCEKAYQSAYQFLLNQTVMLSENEKMDIAAFLCVYERKNEWDKEGTGCVYEEDVREKLKSMGLERT
ncbi:MAG: KAP family NTPase [Lachnospiraceae bacterium]|nr:KAP family NTPase [Lachnospiraceae bacterium]